MSASRRTPVPDRTQSSRLPGAFDTDTDLEGGMEDDPSSLLPPHPPQHEPSGLFLKPGHSTSATKSAMEDQLTQHESHIDNKHNNNTVLEEQDMKDRLGDFESSFVPELSHLSIQRPDDSLARQRYGEEFHLPAEANRDAEGLHSRQASGQFFTGLQSPKTPPGTYMTPALEQQEARLHRDGHQALETTPDMPNISALEALSSSPTAARTVSRVQSLATLGGYETADDHDFPESPTKKVPRHTEDPEATPRKNNELASSQTTAGVPVPVHGHDLAASPHATPSRRRPKYLNSRSSHARLSYDSMTSSTTDTSDATLGADFALQSGGAVPESRLQRKPRMVISRSTSLGSIASGVSNLSDEETNTKRAANAAETPELSTLQEESPVHARSLNLPSLENTIVTPRASASHLVMPTDTVVANHVRDLEVPGSFARQYRQSQNPAYLPGQDDSPSKPLSMAAMTPGPKRGLTLKEHRSTVEKLGKENFDLKMKIHFLDQALQRRSEDGVKEMITENVQLKSDRMRLEKDNHSLRKQVKELQKKLEEFEGGRQSPNADPGYGTDEDRSPTVEEEVIYLRERVETTEVEVERLRAENIAKEGDKRRLAEMVRSLGERGTGGSDVGSREERDMWKDMLESETIAREQSEEENKRLKEEIARLRPDSIVSTNQPGMRKPANGSVVSRSSSVEKASLARGDNNEVERLRHEINELQKMISAQASTLTSRNKEKERLYQEIEDLKIGRMGGMRSVAGDSIFDRSASRARSNSRASNSTRFSRLSEPERDQLEARIGELRDEVSTLRLDNQNLQNQFDEALAELDALDVQAQTDANAFNEELILLTQERDNALAAAEDQDVAFQQLKKEAQEEIDGLGDELDAKVEECDRLGQELQAQSESAMVLQNEVRSASEGLIRLEQDSQQNLSQYQNVKAELDNARRHISTMEKNMSETESEIRRMQVQQESSHNEIAFLREEQDADKIKIGDLESLLKKVHLNLDTERDKARDLERRLNDERSQHEHVSSQEKLEVQKALNDLNREAANSKEELRRIRKALQQREIEVTTHKDRLSELEDSLRHILRDPNGTRSSLVTAVSTIQRNLDLASTNLDHTSKQLDEHQDLLHSRDQLLENAGLEVRTLTDLLERERQARRQDKHSFEQSLKSHQQASRALSQNNARIVELEQARGAHRKQTAQLEAQFKEQLAERNQILLTIWKRMSALCGPDWTHNHSLINGNLPSQEVIGNILFWPGFSRNLLLAAKQVEGTLSVLKDKVKRTERDLWKEFHQLEQTFEARNKKLERIEEHWEKLKLRQNEIDAGVNIPFGHRSHPDTTKLRNENKMLRAENHHLQQQLSHAAQAAHSRSHARTESRTSAGMSMDGTIGLDVASGGGIPNRRSSIGRAFTPGRNNSTRVHDAKSPVGADRTARPDSMYSTNSRPEEWQASPTRASGTGVVPSMGSNLMIRTGSNADRQSPERGQPAYLMTAAHSVRSHQTVLDQKQGTRDGARPSTSMTNQSNPSEAGSYTTAQLLTMGGDQSKWIHRLRELERRLKAEREQRLIDRSGMRKRLEEREAVNEELRKELEREKLRGQWRTEEQDVPTMRQTAAGISSVNDRVVEVEGSPVRPA